MVVSEGYKWPDQILWFWSIFGTLLILFGIFMLININEVMGAGIIGGGIGAIVGSISGFFQKKNSSGKVRAF